MFNSLQEKLEGTFKNLKGQGIITEINIATTLKEIRRALVDADVNYKIAKEFTDKVKDKAMGEKVINAISPGQLMTKIVKDELAELMGGEEADRKSTRLNSSHSQISYAVFCLKKKTQDGHSLVGIDLLDRPNMLLSSHLHHYQIGLQHHRIHLLAVQPNPSCRSAAGALVIVLG